MSSVFADTFYWVALLNPDDPDHERVITFDLSPERPSLVTTESEVTEFLTYFSGRGSLFRGKAAAVAYALVDDPDVRLLPQTSASFSVGLRLRRASGQGIQPDRLYLDGDHEGGRNERVRHSRPAFRAGGFPGAIPFLVEPHHAALTVL